MAAQVSSPPASSKEKDLPAIVGLPLEANFGYRVSRLHFLFAKATGTAYAAYELTTHQWKVLSVIHQHAPMAASSIRPWVTFDKSAISRAVRQLQALRLIDRRLTGHKIDIVLTKKGRQLADDVALRIAAIQEQVMRGIPKAQRDAFMSTIELLEHELGAIVGPNAVEEGSDE